MPFCAAIIGKVIVNTGIASMNRIAGVRGG